MQTDKSLAFYDSEIYKNFSCFNFEIDGKQYSYTHFNNDEVNKPINIPEITWIIKICTLVGFNNKGYDDIMLLLAYYGKTNQFMYDVSQRIIVDKEPVWVVIKELTSITEYDPKVTPITLSMLDSIDIMNVLVGKAGLKLYGSRINSKKLQELPIDFDKITTYSDQQTLIKYCHNDVTVTKELYYVIEGEIILRIQMSELYGIDLRSKSGPQIAQTLLVKMCEDSNGFKIKKPVIGVNVPLEMKYEKPWWIKFKTKKYQHLLHEIESDIFRLNPQTGHLILGNSVKDRIVQIEDCSIKLGIGGQHAVINPGVRYSDDQWAIVEADYASLYPNMIVNSNSYPVHFGPFFFETYKAILSSRLEDKKAGRLTESDAKKLILNSSFGQFSSKYSMLYAPNLLLNTTLSGQLTLLMLIEKIEACGFYPFTTNTDSITLRLERSRLDEFYALCDEHMQEVNLTLEYDFYKMYVAQNVNSYFAVYE